MTEVITFCPQQIDESSLKAKDLLDALIEVQKDRERLQKENEEFRMVYKIDPAENFKYRFKLVCKKNNELRKENEELKCCGMCINYIEKCGEYYCEPEDENIRMETSSMPAPFDICKHFECRKERKWRSDNKTTKDVAARIRGQAFIDNAVAERLTEPRRGRW